MSRGIKIRTLFIALAVSCAAGGHVFCAGPRSNDFTQSNITLKKDEMEKKKWTPETLNQDWTKQFEKKSFKTDADASSITNRKANLGEGLEAKEMLKSGNDLSGRQYVVPQYGETLSDKKWVAPENSALPRNLDRTLNKEYSGSIDFSQKNLSDINKQYVERMGEIQENTMRELNKFFSRDDFQDGGVPITKAGSQDNAMTPKTDSLLDMIGLGSSTDVGRPTIQLDKSGAFGAFTGKRRASEDYNSNTSSSENVSNSEKSTAYTAARNYQQVSPPPSKNAVSAALNKPRTAPVDDGKVKIAERKIDTRNYKGSFFGLPKELQSGEAKVEVKVNR